MLKRKALMESISSNLHNFLKKINKNLSLPSRKFLRDAMIGILRAYPNLAKIASNKKLF